MSRTDNRSRLAAWSLPIGQPQYPKPGNTVLVVDDEDGMRSFVEFALQQIGFATVSTGSGLDAIARFHAAASSVVLVVLDVAMPGMRGAEVLRAMRATRPHLPAVVISGHAIETARAGFGDADRVAFLRKPFGMTALQAEVRRLLAAE
ncbi:MAG: response regulator [Gemmatimonadaceae bacterium]